jgi:hypothetical protein
MKQMHDDGEDSPWSVAGMIKQLSTAANDKIHKNDNHCASIQRQLLVGEYDQMSPVDQVQALEKCLGWDAPSPNIIHGCGHAVPMEAPRLWRQNVLDFLDDE